MIRIIAAALGCLLSSGALAQSIVSSTTAGRAPTASELAPTNLLINRADGLLYYIDAGGTVRFGTLLQATATGKAAVLSSNAAALATAAGLGTTSSVLFGAVSSPGQVKSTLSAGGSQSAFLASAVNPSFALQGTGRAADQANWDVILIGSSLYFRAVNDANGAATNWLTVNRGSGYTITSVAIGAPLTLAPYTVAGLPACGASLKGSMAYVTDAASPAYNASLTGGGSVAVPAFCNGAGWTAH